MARVYISSTSNDLQNERRSVRDAIRRLYHQAAGMEQYGAREERPLQVCIDDVRASHIYIGIIAWRRGHCPLEGGGKSITELEYEAAGHASIPRLLYLVPSREQWGGAIDSDLRPIETFRARLQDRHTVKFFGSCDELEKQVLADIPRYLSARGKSSELSLLPYLCDRDDQRDILQGAIACPPDRIPVCLLHGVVDELPEKFLDCLKARLVSEWCQATGPAKELKLRWPTSSTPDQFELQLQRNLAAAMNLAVTTPRDELEDWIAHIHAPVLITLPLSACEWRSQNDVLLHTVLGFFDAWQAAHGPTLVVLWASYHPIESGLRAALGFRSDRCRRSALLRKSFQAVQDAPGDRARVDLFALPPLPSITEDKAVDWARSDPIQPFHGTRGDFVSQVRELFNGHPLSMRALAPSLLRCLQVNESCEP